RPPVQLGVPGLERELSRDEDEPAGFDRLRVRGTLERRGRGFGANDLLHDSSRRRGRHACASATPSALKIASRTCCVSLPSIRRTWTVRPAAWASSLRKRPTRSLERPPTRASERSTLETTSGRPDASSTTWASASSAGTTADP